ncbi:hypothetical protein Tco_1161529 [Tanacetum coccineum]
MADLKFVDQHNMVAFLEKTEENAEFHQIVDFFSTCSINYALTVSPTIYASYIEQFWNTTTSKTVNSVKQIHAIVDGKAVVISESSVRSDLLFNDEDGIACLTNDEIFENLALMGYEQLSTKLTFQKGGDSVERAITTDASLVAAQDSDNILKTQSTTMSNDPLSQEIGSGDRPRRQDTTLGGADAQTRPETASKMSHNPPLSENGTNSGNDGNKYLINKKGSCLRGSKDCSRQSDHQIEIEGQEARKEEKGKNSITYEEKTGRNDDQVSTARPKVSAVGVPVNVSVATPSTPLTTTTIFGDEDLTIAQKLVKMRSEKAKEKEKGVVLIDEEEPPRLNRSTTTLQPLPTIDPKDKELAQKLHEEELAESDRAQKERQKQEEATSAALAEKFDEIQARIDVDRELVVRLTHEEQEKYTIEERARLLA